MRQKRKGGIRPLGCFIIGFYVTIMSLGIYWLIKVLTKAFK